MPRRLQGHPLVAAHLWRGWSLSNSATGATALSPPLLPSLLCHLSAGGGTGPSPVPAAALESSRAAGSSSAGSASGAVDRHNDRSILQADMTPARVTLGSDPRVTPARTGPAGGPSGHPADTFAEAWPSLLQPGPSPSPHHHSESVLQQQDRRRRPEAESPGLWPTPGGLGPWQVSVLAARLTEQRALQEQGHRGGSTHHPPPLIRHDPAHGGLTVLGYEDTREGPSLCVPLRGAADPQAQEQEQGAAAAPCSCCQGLPPPQYRLQQPEGRDTGTESGAGSAPQAQQAPEQGQRQTGAKGDKAGEQSGYDGSDEDDDDDGGFVPPNPDATFEDPGMFFVLGGAVLSALLAILVGGLGIVGAFYAGYAITLATRERMAEQKAATGALPNTAAGGDSEVGSGGAKGSSTGGV